MYIFALFNLKNQLFRNITQKINFTPITPSYYFEM